MKIHARRAVWLAALLVCVAGPVAAQTTWTVDVVDNSFDPQGITICEGDTIDWDWTGNNPHSSTYGDACDSDNFGLLWDSGVLNNGALFSHFFPSVPSECAEDAAEGDNTCAYICSVHCNSMRGTITIVDAATAGLGISQNQVRTNRDGDGRGGTIKGSETFEGTDFNEIVGGIEVTITLDNGIETITETVTAVQIRPGSFKGTFDQNNAAQMNIRRITISAGKKDPSAGKVTIKFETNDYNLSVPVTNTIDLMSTNDTACGLVDLLGTFTGPLTVK